LKLDFNKFLLAWDIPVADAPHRYGTSRGVWVCRGTRHHPACCAQRSDSYL